MNDINMVNMCFEIEKEREQMKKEIIFACRKADPYGFTPTQESIVERCVNHIYMPYIESYDMKQGKCDSSLYPTFQDFCNFLVKQCGYDAFHLSQTANEIKADSAIFNLMKLPTGTAEAKQ